MIVFGGDYEHTLDLPSVQNGVAVGYQVLERPALFATVLERKPFDACEFSLANYIMLRDRGANWLTALPIFPARAFRHGTIVVRRDSPAEAFPDLAAARIGVADYSMTAAVWTRGILAEDGGPHWSQLRWYSAGKPRFAPPASAHVTNLPVDLEAALADGKLDALLHPRASDLLKPAGDRRFRPLLRDWRRAELDYYRRTGIYPISHAVVVPRAVAEQVPAWPGAVMAAYRQGMAHARQRRLATTLLPWGEANWSETMAVFGDDPMPYGLEPGNLAVIGKLQDYLLEQELIGRRHPVEELFFPG